MWIPTFWIAVFAVVYGAQEEKKWPECPSAASDKTSSQPLCDPCSPKVYTLYNEPRNTNVFYADKKTKLKNANLQGWTRFGAGTGKLYNKCTFYYTCGSVFPVWLNGDHPSVEDGIVEAETCLQYNIGNCCQYKEQINIKNCGNYYVYRLTANKPLASNYQWSYCIEPKAEELPNVCEDSRFELLEDVTNRGELETHSGGSRKEPIDVAEDNKWYSFKVGKGMIKQGCAGVNHCGFRFPMYIEEDYPTKDGVVKHVMSYTTNDLNLICEKRSTMPVYIVKCGDKYYHRVDTAFSYSGYCVEEDYEDVCKSAFTLSESWRGITVDKARDHCDTNGIHDWNSWYRIGVYEKRMPEQCVAPNKCGGDTGYWLSGGHPKVGDGIVGRYMYYASATNCRASKLEGHVLNCGDKDEDDYVYMFKQPSGCDRVFCADEDPCSSRVYQRLDQEARAGRSGSDVAINDYTLNHGWYRFVGGLGIMARSTILPGHTKISYPAWYEGDLPQEQGQIVTGKACFKYNANNCYWNAPVSIKNCKDFFVYHLERSPPNGGGYPYEEDVCEKDIMNLDQEWRLAYNLNAVVQSDHVLKAGWYEVTIGNKRLNTDPSLYKHGSTGKYPGWMEGEHPTEEEGIVERTVYFTTSESNPKGNKISVYIRNCGSRFIYYLRPFSTNYFYTVSQPLCQEGSYEELDQEYRLITNPADTAAAQNSDNQLFKLAGWYRFMNGFGRVVEAPRNPAQYSGGFLYPYQFPEGSHAGVAAGDISEPILLEHNRGAGNPHYTGWAWKVSIANCGNYYLYKIPGLHSSYSRAGLVVDDAAENVCKANRYKESADTKRLVSSTTVIDSSDATLELGWYRLTAGLGYIPGNKFSGTQCSTSYHGHLRDPHPEGDEIQQNLVQFYSTNPNSIASSRTTWVKKCNGFYVYRLRESPGAKYRYCEATEGCDKAEALTDYWRVTSRKVLTGRYESSNFGNDRWVYFTEGLKRLPEAPPPKSVAGCTYNGYIDSHPTVEEGAVLRTMRFPGSTKTEQIQVQNCGDRFVYFLSKTIQNDYCYAATTDVCDAEHYTEINDRRRLHYSFAYGSSLTRFNLDNQFNGWVRYTIGLGRLMEEAPAADGMCTTEFQGWVNGKHPTKDEGVVRRELCWRYNKNNCYSKGEISIKNCGSYYVYGIATPPPNNQYGHCVEQNKKEVCESAKKLYNPQRGMNTATTNYINDQNTILSTGYYRFMSHLGRLTAFEVKENNCGGQNKILIEKTLDKDLQSGDALFQIRAYTTGWSGSTYRALGLQCDNYWVYHLPRLTHGNMAYCIEENLCNSTALFKIYTGINSQWLYHKTGNLMHQLTTGWYEVKVGTDSLSHSPPDVYDCGAAYPGYVNRPPPSRSDGIVDAHVCYRTNINSAPTQSCQKIYMKACPDKTIYYLTKTHNANYAICGESDVCEVVEGMPLDNTWRLSGNPAASNGYDNLAVGWYRVPIGHKRLAVTREEATCGTRYPGWLQLGRHPSVSEGIVNSKICFDTGAAAPANCKDVQVVNCGTHYLYHMRPSGGNYGTCVASAEDSMCTSYKTLDEEWRSVEYSATRDKTDTSLEAGWYRFGVGLGRMPTTCPQYLHGGGHYPSYTPDVEIPEKEEEYKQITIHWRYSNRCSWISKTGYIKNCGEFLVYWLPSQTQGYTTYNVEVELCSADQYSVLDSESLLAWKQTTNLQSHNTLSSGWYRLTAGLNKINTECVPMDYGGTKYPGWMDGGHPDVGETVDRTVYFRVNSNCKATSKSIKVKNCGAFYIYRLVPTSANYGYTISSEPCDVEPRLLAEEDRSVYARSATDKTDNGMAEGWYQFTSGYKVIAKAPPASYSCASKAPTWMDGADPEEGEGIAERTVCSVRYDSATTQTDCAWATTIKVRNCGNKMLYYFDASPPTSAARYCVDDDMSKICEDAKSLSDIWRGSDRPGRGHNDAGLPAGWYKFTKYGKRIASYPVRVGYAGSTYPIWMDGQHAEKGTCKYQAVYSVYSNTNVKWRGGNLYECQCKNGDYIYFHNPKAAPVSQYETTYAEEEDPCEKHERITSTTRSPWFTAKQSNTDHSRRPYWVRLMAGTNVMPHYRPEVGSCGVHYPGWYDGEMPTEVGQTTKGRYCFVTSASEGCHGSYVKEARVKKCDGFFVYHWPATTNAYAGYCVDEAVCDVASEEWGREESHRLRYTSINGYVSSLRKQDNGLITQWYRITIGTKKLPNTCTGWQSCGTLYPGWMEGEHPKPEDGIVDRDVCFTNKQDCCSSRKTIKVVACTKGDESFYLYRLYATSSSYGYCIDESPEKVCEIPDAQLHYITDERHGTAHYRDDSFQPDYKKYPQAAWFVVGVFSKHFIHYPPVQNFCGSAYPGWVEDPAPGINDGVIETRSCFRQSSSNEVCYQGLPMKVKNCNGQMRYLYQTASLNYASMCVEEDVCQKGSYREIQDETWRHAYTKTQGSGYHHDYRKVPTSPYRDWIRFTGVGNGRIPTINQEYLSCGTQFPAWMDGEHPEEEDGVVSRYMYLTNGNNYKWQNQQIFVRNCGDFMLYNINYNWLSNYKWAVCVDGDVCDADVVEVNEAHRLKSAWGRISSTGDNGLARGWYRFTNGFETMPEECPIAYSCGSTYPGYLAEPHPEMRDGIVERKVCFGDADQCCYSSITVLVKNCGAHYVYRLYPTGGHQKYCVEESADAMCDTSAHKELNGAWRGENNPYDSANQHNDNVDVPHGWYRFTTDLGRMPEYSLPYLSCGYYYPGYLAGGPHPTRQEGIVNRQACFSTSAVNEGQNCKNVRVKNCGKFYVYELVKTGHQYYGYCVAQEQCQKANELNQRWRLIINPTVSGQSKAADQSLRKGWYRFTAGHGVMPGYQPDNYYGGATYPGYMEGDLPTEDERDVERIVRFGSTGNTKKARVKNCGTHYIYHLQPSPGSAYSYTIDTEVCLHARELGEDWRNIFYVSETEDDLHSDKGMGKDWYQFTTGFKMMAEAPPRERYSCGTRFPAYLNQGHPLVPEGVVKRDVCFKKDQEGEHFQACQYIEKIRVKNCGDFFAYQLNPTVTDGAYCVYNRKSSCSPNVIHAKYGDKAVINCTLNSEKDFDSSEVQWTKLDSMKLPNDNLDKMTISDDKLLVNIDDITDEYGGVYSMFIPSTETSELVEVILYNAIETEQKYYFVDSGDDVKIDVTFNVVPEPKPSQVSWTKLPNKKVEGGKYKLSDDHKSLHISGVSANEAGTYRCTLHFEISGKKFKKFSDVIVKLNDEN